MSGNIVIHQPAQADTYTTRPCASCPWVRDHDPAFLSPAGARELVLSNLEGRTFACHATHDLQRPSDLSQRDLEKVQCCVGQLLFNFGDGQEYNVFESHVEILEHFGVK